MKEGNLQASKRLPIDWQEADFWDSESLEHELERVFDICHGCRRCVSLCESFPTLFDLVDESPTLEVDGVAKSDYAKVVDECYLCDLCAEIKCPYLPPHDWAVDFPHLMLRAKAQKFRAGKSKWRDRLITSTDKLLPLVSKPIIAGTINLLNKNSAARTLIEATTGIHKSAPLPKLKSRAARSRHADSISTPGSAATAVQAGDQTTGKVAIFTTCYGNHIAPDLIGDFLAVFAHNNIDAKLLSSENCCGMPKLELGDLDSVAALKDTNIPVMLEAVGAGYDIIAPIPSCSLMFRQELPLLFPDDDAIAAVAARCFDPFEYLTMRHKAGLLNTDFAHPLGKVVYHAACHQRAQRVGPKTRELFALIPDTELVAIERCSGHDGTYAWKQESYAHACKIAAPVVRQTKKAAANAHMSDCIMAGTMIEHGMRELGSDVTFNHPMQLLRQAYGSI